jgi:hypothetical protein
MVARGALPAAPPPAGRGRGSASPVPADTEVTGEAAAIRGRKVCAGECTTGRGTRARRTEDCAGLVRSGAILHDRCTPRDPHPSDEGACAAISGIDELRLTAMIGAFRVVMEYDE